MPSRAEGGKRLALVTGASGGIGLEFAKLLARAGYDLALAARSRDKLESLSGDLQARFGISAEPIAVDLSLPDAPSQLFARVPECEVLINNAGVASNGKFARLDKEALLGELRLDVVALTELARLYLPGMLARGRGRILNLASTAGFLPGPNMAVYYASKAYVISLSQALGYETRNSGVTVTVLCPGPTATDFQRRANVESTPLSKLPLANAAHVAKAGFDGMMRGKAVVVPGIANKLVAIASCVTPRRLLVAMSGKAVERSDAPIS